MRVFVVSALLIALCAAGIVTYAPRITSMITFGWHLAVLGKFAPQDGREQRVLRHVLETAVAGDPASVLSAIDGYAWKTEWFMNVGDVKGRLVEAAINNMTDPPTRLLELGTYVGYGSVKVAAAVALRNRQAMLYTLDVVEANSEIARQVVKFAGLSGHVTSLVGSLDKQPQLLGTKEEEGGGPAPFDFVFLDHVKERYVADLELLLSHGLLRPGAVVVADNVRFPGAPEYYKYMQTSPVFATEWFETTLEYSDNIRDLVGVSVYTPPTPGPSSGVHDSVGGDGGDSGKQGPKQAAAAAAEVAGTA